MIRVLSYLFLCLTVANSALAEGTLRHLQTLDQAKEWRAVGKIQMASGQSCTGVLIAPSQVLTAAHCVYRGRSDSLVAPTEITFLAGLRLHGTQAIRSARRYVIAPKYEPADKKTGPTPTSVSNDIALIELSQPIDSDIIQPFEIKTKINGGEQVSVVSYAKGRNGSPAIEDSCDVVRRQFNLIMMNCEVDFGSSGSPVFVREANSVKVASIISSMGDVEGERYAFGMQLRSIVQDLQDKLQEDATVFQSKKPGQSLSEQLGRN